MTSWLDDMGDVLFEPVVVYALGAWLVGAGVLLFVRHRASKHALVRWVVPVALVLLGLYLLVAMRLVLLSFP